MHVDVPPLEKWVLLKPRRHHIVATDQDTPQAGLEPNPTLGSWTRLRKFINIRTLGSARYVQWPMHAQNRSSSSPIPSTPPSRRAPVEARRLHHLSH